MDSQRLSDLIGLVYDSAVDLDLWPLLLQALAAELELSVQVGAGAGSARPRPAVEQIERLGDYVSHWYHGQADSDHLLAEEKVRHYGAGEEELFHLLLPHLVRAIKINRELVELSVENRAYAAVLERLPIGMVVADSGGRIYAKNRQFDTLLGHDAGVCIEQGRLTARRRSDAQLLSQLIAAVAQGGGQQGGQALRLAGAWPMSLLILPMSQGENPSPRPKVIIFAASRDTEVAIQPQALQEMYDLTQAEARMTLALVNGLSIDEMAEQYHVSKHTLRTQLKAVYAKTGCRRQAELVVKILTGPAILAGTSGLSVDAAAMLPELASLEPEGRTHQSVFLADGRRLGYAEYGPAQGYPTIFMHAIIGSRLQVPTDETPLFAHNIRLLVPERPGFGLSDSKDERNFTDWADDVAEFADSLGIDRFAVMGYSLGGCFAMAVAHQLPQRVSRVFLISTMGPYQSIEDLHGMLPMFRMLLGLSKYVPSVTMSFMRMVMRSIVREPDKFFDRVLEQLPTMDREVMALPEVRRPYINSMLEAVRGGNRDLLMEQLMIGRDWGFDLAAIEVPVELWHGDLDRHAPLQMAQSVAARLPQVSLTVVPGAGHYLVYHIWGEVIATMSSRLRGA